MYQILQTIALFFSLSLFGQQNRLSNWHVLGRKRTGPVRIRSDPTRTPAQKARVTQTPSTSSGAAARQSSDSSFNARKKRGRNRSVRRKRLTRSIASPQHTRRRRRHGHEDGHVRARDQLRQLDLPRRRRHVLLRRRPRRAVHGAPHLRRREHSVPPIPSPPLLFDLLREGVRDLPDSFVLNLGFPLVSRAVRRVPGGHQEYGEE